MVWPALGICELLETGPWKVTKKCPSIVINKLQYATQRSSLPPKTFRGFPSHKNIQSHCSRRYICFQHFNLFHVSSPAAPWQNKHGDFQLGFPLCSLKPRSPQGSGSSSASAGKFTASAARVSLSLLRHNLYSKHRHNAPQRKLQDCWYFYVLLRV